MKIGRNDPCPCGSGKKYKNCHIDSIPSKVPDRKEDKIQDIESPIKFLSPFDKIDLLKTFAAIQLLPSNHGKNERFESLAREILFHLKGSNRNIEIKELKKFLNEKLNNYVIEDPVSTLFTENLIFYAGNSIVFPGLNEDGTEILNTYLEAIFTTENNLPEIFKTNIRDATMLIGGLSDFMAKSANLSRYAQPDTNNHYRAIVLPEKAHLEKCKRIVCFSETEVHKMASYYEIDFNIINEFIFDTNDVTSLAKGGNDNPLIQRPIIKHENKYIFVIPTAIVNCLTEFIFRIAKKENCVEELLKLYYSRQWYKVHHLINEMNWWTTDIQLPPKNERLPIEESVFRFDNDKLAYVCFVKQEGLESEWENENDSYEEFEKQQNELDDMYEARVEEVINYLEKLNAEKPFRYLTIFILGDCGKEFYFAYPKPSEGNQTLGLKFGEFEKLVFTGKMNGFALWKFAKAYQIANDQTTIMNLGGLLDAYVIYDNNNESLLDSDHSRPDILNIAPGDSSDFQREIVTKRDIHAVLQYTIHGLVPVPVRRLREFAPFYIEREKSIEFNMLLETFDCPIWVRNKFISNKDLNDSAQNFSEAIIFWLYKMREELNEFLRPFKKFPVEINLGFEDAFFDIKSPIEHKELNPDELDFQLECDIKTFSITIPANICFLMIKPNNTGEKTLMKAVLTGLKILIEKNEFEKRLDDKIISDLVEKYLAPSTAKMILFFDSANNLLIDPRWLLPLRTVQDNDGSIILDNLVKDINLDYKLPEIISSTKEKNNLCNRIVTVLIQKIDGKLKKFNSGELLKWLMNFHERCIQVKEYREMHIPAKIACFSDFPSEVEKLQKDNSELAESTLSYRCLVEFIAATPHFGSDLINMDDIDELLALMAQVIEWGRLSDIINFKMDDPKMGILPSGRIGTDKSFFIKYFNPMDKAKIESVVFDYQQSFESIFSEKKPDSISDDIPEDVKEIDNCFEKEYGISLTKILKIQGELVSLALINEKSFMKMEVSVLEENLIGTDLMSEEDIIVCLNYLTLSNRESLIRSPDGYEKEDIYPWQYNRALSYLRKPIIKIEDLSGNKFYYWSFRHVLSSAENLQELLFSGRLKARKDGLLDKYVKRINTEKGTIYRNKVKKWLTENTELEVIDYEVKIDINGHLIAEKDLGDIDVLAIDNIKKIFYSIECKNTLSARTIREMKTELDKYLGQNNDDEGNISMHLERDIWLKDNINQLKKFSSDAMKYKIKSLVLTSQEIPVIYLAKEKYPLPILSFKRLKRIGVSILNSV